MRASHVAVLLLGLAACGEGKEERAKADSAMAASRLARLNDQVGDPRGRTDVPLAKWLLPKDMREISGITLTPDGNSVLAHADESAHVVSVDWRTGIISKRFDLGEQSIKGDFEGITRVGLDYYMLTSKGEIYRFREGEHRDRVQYTVTDTKLGKECEFEGVAHDPLINSLLLACKRPQKSMRDSLVIYRWPLGADPDAVSRITIPLDLVIGSNDWNDLHPSDITIDPFTGNYVLITAQERALIVVTRDGRVVSSGPIPTDIAHAEGVAITRNGLLLIGAEAGESPASITIFRWPRDATSDTTAAASVQQPAVQPSTP